MQNIRKSMQNGCCSSLSNFLTACFISRLPLVACCSHFFFFNASRKRKDRRDDWCWGHGSALRRPLCPPWVSAVTCPVLSSSGRSKSRWIPEETEGQPLLEREPSSSGLSASAALLVLTRIVELIQVTQCVVCVPAPLQASVSPALVPQRQTWPCPILSSKVMTSPSGT